KPRRLWIDALCICQDDTKEREAQVSIMQHIFAQATDVMAWIGEDNGAPDQRAIDFMRELSAKSKSYIHAEPHGTVSSGERRPLDEQTVDWLESATPFGIVDSIWLDFTALIDRPWFCRIWIVQEVVMGKEVTVQCGPHQFSWGALFNCALFVHEHAQLIQSFAAPDCLRHHSPEKAEFYSNSLPLYHLLRATKNIRSVGYLVSKRQMHRLIEAIAEPAIKQYLLQEPSTKHEPPGHLWGMISPNLRSLNIYSTRPPQKHKHTPRPKPRPQPPFPPYLP
ncbi:heterokaryon incompatibility protein-domain-containing protein, partial [Parachaetomium inaequale]